jgi:hypothetical protein
MDMDEESNVIPIGVGFPVPDQPVVPLYGAVDLAKFRQKDQYRHQWIMVQNIPCVIDFRWVLDEAGERVKGEDGEGEVEKDDEGKPMVNVLLVREGVAMEGPGCRKCGRSMQSALTELCEVSDEEFARRGSPVKTPEPDGHSFT